MASREEDSPLQSTYGNSVSVLSRKFSKLRPTSKKKCAYNIRLVKSRGALLVLVWNLLVFSYQATALATIVDLLILPRISMTYPWKYVVAIILLQGCLPFFIYPIAGWIADAKIGRYKVIRASLWIMWIGSLLLVIEKTILYILNNMVRSDTKTYEPVKPTTIIFVLIVYVINLVGIAGFQANLIPFGVDQMEDGSSDEYSAFINWYYWTKNTSIGFIIQIAVQSAYDYCKAENTPYLYEPTERYDLIILVLQVGFVTVALCLDFLFSDRVLNKDPKTYNPLKKIYKISKFVAKNNRLVGYRKAITYTYNERLQRTDFAKHLYGGPFEGDNVEDVKTFWKMVVFLLSLGFGGFFVFYAVYSTVRSYVDHMTQTDILSSSLSKCTSRHIISELIYPLVITAVIPFHEFVVYPLFRKWIPRIMKRIALGMIIMTLAVVGMLIMDSVGHAQTEGPAACMLYHSPSDPSTQVPIAIKMEYFLPFVILFGLGEVLTFIPAFEFIIAQSPFSMRGLMIGLFYAIDGLFAGLVGILALVIAKTSPHIVMNGLSCGSCFYLVTAVVGIVGIVLFLISCVWYKKRQRGGRSMVNDQAVIESYFETSDTND